MPAQMGPVLECLAIQFVKGNCTSQGKMAKSTQTQILELRGWSSRDADNYAMGMIPAGRPTNTEEVAKAIWQIFDLPDYVNGAVIDVMGGA